MEELSLDDSFFEEEEGDKFRHKEKKKLGLEHVNYYPKKCCPEVRTASTPFIIL